MEHTPRSHVNRAAALVKLFITDQQQ